MTDLAKRSTVAPLTAYLASVPAASSRTTTLKRLRSIVAILQRKPVASVTVEAARAFPWETITYDTALTVSAVLQGQNLAPATINATMDALKGVLRQAWLLGLVPREVVDKIAELKRVSNVRPPAGRALSEDEIILMLNVCGGDAKGARDRAILALLYGCGLRRDEAINLRVEDYNATAATIRVRGKGNKIADVPAAPWVVDALDLWLEFRGTSPKCDTLLIGVTKVDSLRYVHLTGAGIAFAVRMIARAAGVVNVTPHDLRRTFVTEALRTDDVLQAQRLARHASPATTARYDRRTAEELRDVVERMPDPTRGRT